MCACPLITSLLYGISEYLLMYELSLCIQIHSLLSEWLIQRGLRNAYVVRLG